MQCKIPPGWKIRILNILIRITLISEQAVMWRLCMCQDGICLFQETTEEKLLVSIKQYLESKLLIENRIKGLSVDFCLKFLLFIRQQEHFHVGIGCAPHVQGGQLGRLDDPHQQLK